jgi:cytosine/adenosine deaminase-related metal-dependent hydrolase
MTFRAKWILPIAGPPVRDGWVSVEQGRVTAVGQGLPPGPARDLGDVALLPGLVNAHTHLELSWMAGRVPPADSMDEWIRSLMRLRAAGPAGGDAEAADAMAQAASGMFSTGTTVVGDVSNSLTSVPVFARFQMAAVVFHEILGFKPADPVVQVRAARKRCQESLLPEKTPDGFSAVVALGPN